MTDWKQFIRTLGKTRSRTDSDSSVSGRPASWATAALGMLARMMLLNACGDNPSGGSQATSSSDRRSSEDGTLPSRFVDAAPVTVCPAPATFTPVNGDAYQTTDPLSIDELGRIQCKYEAPGSGAEVLGLIVYNSSFDAEQFMARSRRDAGVCLDGSCDTEGSEPHTFYLEDVALGDDAFVHGETTTLIDPFYQTAFLLVRVGSQVCASSWGGVSTSAELQDGVRILLTTASGVACGLQPSAS